MPKSSLKKTQGDLEEISENASPKTVRFNLPTNFEEISEKTSPKEEKIEKVSDSDDSDQEQPPITFVSVHYNVVSEQISMNTIPIVKPVVRDDEEIDHPRIVSSKTLS